MMYGKDKGMRELKGMREMNKDSKSPMRKMREEKKMKSENRTMRKGKRG